MTSITLRDFQPLNTWKPFKEGPIWEGSNIPAYLTDMTTGRVYWNESRNTVGVKCALLTLGTPIVHSVASIVNLAYRVVKLVSFLFREKAPTRNEILADLLRIPATPFAVVGLELAAIYGIFRPYNGRKLYASIERAQYGDYVLAPCFQPDPHHHLLGGDPSKRNSF